MVSQSAFPTAAGLRPAPSVTELLAIMLSKHFIAAAADELRADLPDVGTVEIAVADGRWTCRLACDDPAETTRPALRAQAAEQARAVCDQIDAEARQRRGWLTWLKTWGCPGGLVAAAGLVGAGVVPGDPRELVFAGFAVAVPAIVGIQRLPRVIRRASAKTERDKRAVTEQFDAAAGQLADLWAADRRSTEMQLPELRRYLRDLSPDSVVAAIRTMPGVPLPRTREFPSWTPRPPRRHPALEAEDELASLDD
jgi:hypothetical protein